MNGDGENCFRNSCHWTFRPFRSKFQKNAELTLPKPKEAADEIEFTEEPSVKEDILIVRKIDPCIDFNGINHYTDRYELMRRKFDRHLVVRRGQPFRIIIQLSRKYDYEKDGISFIFTADDEKISYGQKSLIVSPLLKKPEKAFIWNAVLISESENSISVNIFTDPESVIGKWKLEIDTRIIDGGAYSYSWDTDIFILFNPWCKRDRVYMSSETWREEAVLNETGLIWRGTFNQTKPVVWKYDQFEQNILECSLYVLNYIGNVKGIKRSDPVAVARALAAAVNSADDNGVVVGNWSEDFSGGTAPTKWLGSQEILRKYYKKKKPVKFGQCWVFSGVLTTICRSLGLPTRTVTNYSSAHDTQGSLTVDYFLNEDGDLIEDLNSDSVWTFHVWNEVWTSRRDLDEKFDGWQVIDATPQEPSENIYQAGPASVVAIKHGDILKPYDSAFVFAEVNADKIFWLYTGPNEPLKLLQKDTLGIGRMICTKAPGVFDVLDLTHHYKFPERSHKERNTMLKALQQSKNVFARYYVNEEFRDVYFEFQMKSDVKFGENFDVMLKLTNRNKVKNYVVKVLLRVDVISNYIGTVGQTVQKRNFEITSKADSIHEVALEVTYANYSGILQSQSVFKILCFAQVEDTNFDYYMEDDFRLRKPDIKFVIPDEVIEGTTIIVEISVENSLPVPLRKGVFVVEAPGLRKPLVLRVKYAVLPGKKAESRFKLIAPKRGVYSIAAKFHSREIDDVDGFEMLKVSYAPFDINY